MMNPCILVGNGTSLLDASRGPEIDAHECVVRFNRFTTDGYEQHVGHRSDVWFMVHPATCFRAALPWKRVFVHSWTPQQDRCLVLQSHREAYPSRNVRKVDHAILREIAAFMGGDFLHWSTGLLGIWLMLKEHPAVTITGFDWWDRAEHHYNDKAPRGTLHRPQLERDCIMRLEAEGRLHFL